MRKKLSVRDWPESERPAVRAIEMGPEALSDAELLSLILRKCTYEQTEVDVARELLSKAGASGSFLASGIFLSRSRSCFRLCGRSGGAF